MQQMWYSLSVICMRVNWMLRRLHAKLLSVGDVHNCVCIHLCTYVCVFVCAMYVCSMIYDVCSLNYFVLLYCVKRNLRIV